MTVSEQAPDKSSDIRKQMTNVWFCWQLSKKAKRIRQQKGPDTRRYPHTTTPNSVVSFCN